MKRSLVLIHGWGFNGSVWNGLLPQLEQQFEITVIDLPGYRQRPLLEARTLSAMAQDVAQQAPDGAVWLGWSLGGQVALQAALEMPQKISRLMLVGTTPKFVQGRGWRAAVKQKILDDFGDALIRSRETTIGRFLTLQMLGVEGGRARIQELKRGLAEAPRPLGGKKLQGYDNLFRIRVGDWRISYAVEDDRLIVLVLEVAPRGDAYRF